VITKVLSTIVAFFITVSFSVAVLADDNIVMTAPAENLAQTDKATTTDGAALTDNSAQAAPNPVDKSMAKPPSRAEMCARVRAYRDATRNAQLIADTTGTGK
jgi:hypothetical protein